MKVAGFGGAIPESPQMLMLSTICATPVVLCTLAVALRNISDSMFAALKALARLDTADRYADSPNAGASFKNTILVDKMSLITGIVCVGGPPVCKVAITPCTVVINTAINWQEG